MLVKTFEHPTLDSIALGRNPLLVRRPTLHLKNYLLRALPAPPDDADYSVAAPEPLHDILGNNTNGCCTIAGAYHISQAILSSAGSLVNDKVFTTENCLSEYYRLTGGADTGLQEDDVLAYWQSVGLMGTYKIAGKIAVNPKDEVEIKTALWLFENLYFGMFLPDSWVGPPPRGDGFTWALAGPPNPDNGHAFVGVGYRGGNGAGIKIDTWGMFGNMTFPAISFYCSSLNGGQLFSILSEDAIDRATGRAPNGFDFSQLKADLQAFT
jgi:hypothetical protein